ncbi:MULTISPECIES: HAD domain-containing protein [Caballeronia]|uniref:HAD domain-containing protein n=1 Tax=Burkholderiaceae TaxID=119060 RepID=UPI00094F2458
MSSVLYLGVEGVVFPRRTRPQVARDSSASRRPPTNSELLDELSAIAEAASNLQVVLNGSYVVDIGYRRILSLLPHGLASRTVGATTSGNRLHRKNDLRKRADVLRADVGRRNPHTLTIVDASRSAIPIEYLCRSVLVACNNSAALRQTLDQIQRLLLPDHTDLPPET